VDVLGLVLGLVGGLVLSVVWWWWLAHRVTPQLTFADGVSWRSERGNGRVAYRIKLRNTSRRRGIIDVAFRARVTISGMRLFDEAGTSRLVVEMPLDVDHLFRLGPKASRVLWLEFGPTFPDAWGSYLPKGVATALAAGEVGSLETLLAFDGDPVLQVQALAYDEFSGARKYYESPPYRLSNVKAGVFEDLRVVPSS
jgi:hypothetical protein